MSGLLSKAWGSAENEIWTPLVDRVTDQIGVSRMTATLGIVGSVTVVTAVLLHMWKQPRNLPPGPKPLPLFGNLRGKLDGQMTSSVKFNVLILFM